MQRRAEACHAVVGSAPHRRSPTQRHRTIALALVLSIAWIAAGCGSGGGTNTTDSTVDPGAPLIDGGFSTPDADAIASPTGAGGELPVPSNAVLNGAPDVQGGATITNYTVGGVTPGDLIVQYEALAQDQGWIVESGPTQTGSSDYAITLVRADVHLTAFTAAVDSGEQSNQAQLSLQQSQD
jgi:hypothetical protein